MRKRDLEEYSKQWRRLIDDMVEDSQELDEREESDIRELLDEFERDGERILDRIKDILPD